MVVWRREGTAARLFLLVLLALCALVLSTGSPASAAGIVAKDGRIHACYKAKGKGKGTLRVVRNAKVRCPKKWKKVAWNANGPSGSQGEAGGPGANGGAGSNGAAGTPGSTGTVTVKQLEDKVTELLSKVQSLEAILKGIDNQQLQEAVAAVPVVGELCGQAEALTAKSGELGSALGGLGTVLGTLTILALPSIPTALPPFECP